MINFKLAELRKKHNLTQQELGDILCVSYQTISKWENGVVYPDISYLPKLSSYFNVSVDALLGLVPLEQEYRPASSGTADYWEKKLEYLKYTRKIMWNEDYFRFLIREVWNITTPVSILDCGCGYGALGLLLLPLLPEGSAYTGIDFSQTMLDAAKKSYESTDYDVKFILADIREYQTKERYDIVISQAVLRHVDHGEAFLKKMVGYIKTGGMLVCLECNREFEVTGLYVDGMDYGKLCQHAGLEKLWQTELKNQGRDYSIAMKLPQYMKKAGLKHIAARMNDRVTFLDPEQPEYDELLECCIKTDHWDQEKSETEMEELIAYFMNHGMTRNEAENYCRQQNGIIKYLKKHKGTVSLTKCNGIMITYGWKEND